MRNAIIALLLIISADITAQVLNLDLKKDSLIELIKAKGNREVTLIRFKNSKGQTVKSIDLIEDNPYNRLHYKKITPESQSSMYDVSGMILKDILPISKIKEYDPKILDENMSIKSIETGCEINTRNPGFVVVYYPMIIKDIHDWTVSIQTTIRIFDHEGNLISSLENQNFNLESLSITRDAKYIAISYGGVIDEDVTLPSAYIIMELNSHKIIN